MNVIVTFAVYFLFFAVIHSLLATDRIKDIAKNQLGEGFKYYRLVYNILSFPLFAPAFLIWVNNTASTPPVYSVPQWLYPFIILIRLAAIGLFIYAALQLDLLEFAGIRQIYGKTRNVLITKGAYGIVRHPLYTGAIILLLTKAEMSQLDLIAVLFISIYFITGAYIEERRMPAIFGEEYRKYQKNVSMFIPVKWIVKLRSGVLK